MINITQPSALSLSISPTPATCYGTCDGVAAVSVSGGTPSYSLLWSNGLSNYVITGLCAGSYNLTVTDSNNCVESSSVIITEPNPLSFQPNKSLLTHFINQKHEKHGKHQATH